jgi:hypothetical protein
MKLFKKSYPTNIFYQVFAHLCYSKFCSAGNFLKFVKITGTREYLTYPVPYYRGPDFPVVVCFGSFPGPSPPPSSISKLDRQRAGRLRKGEDLLTGGGRVRSQIIRRFEKAWSSINHWIELTAGTPAHLSATHSSQENRRKSYQRRSPGTVFCNIS